MHFCHVSFPPVWHGTDSTFMKNVCIDNPTCQAGWPRNPWCLMQAPLSLRFHRLSKDPRAGAPVSLAHQANPPTIGPCPQFAISGLYCHGFQWLLAVHFGTLQSQIRKPAKQNSPESKSYTCSCSRIITSTRVPAILFLNSSCGPLFLSGAHKCHQARKSKGHVLWSVCFFKGPDCHFGMAFICF